MRFLVDANMPRSALGLLQSLGHTAEHVHDLGMGTAPDSQIAAHVRKTSVVLLSRDLDFADIRNYPPADYPGLIVIRLPDDSVARDILNLLERFVKQTELLPHVAGHLVILEEDRVRFRPALE